VKTVLKSVDFDEVMDKNKLGLFYLCTLYANAVCAMAV